MNFETYFEREYNFLQRGGESFAEKHQDIAGRLRLSERQRKDPFVERLMEAFAFLAGRVHERLDDEIPEFTGGLLEQLFPHFLRPFPSCAILEANPVSGSLTKPVTIPRNSEIQTSSGKYKVKYRVASGPDESARVLEKVETAEFIFRTCFDLTVRPMEIKQVRLEDGRNGSDLIIRIQPHRNIDFQTLSLDHLSLYLMGDKRFIYTLLLYLDCYISHISIGESGSDSRQEILENVVVGIPALSSSLGQPEDTFPLIPYARQSFSGYRLLHEYFSFPERFFFVCIKGLDRFNSESTGQSFDIRISFSRKLSSEFHPTVKNILLHCTPIINLFDRPVEEVLINQKMPEYYIIPDLNRRKSLEIYSVNQVTGVGENRMKQYDYMPINSTEVLNRTDPQYDYKRFFSIAQRPVKGDMQETYIRLFGPSMEMEIMPKETLSIQATLSNGSLPSKYLEVGSVHEPLNFPPGIQAKNLSAPTDVLPCPERKNYLWALIAHLNYSLGTLAEAETLKGCLSLYNWSVSHNNPNKKRIDGIVKIYRPVSRHIMRGQDLIRGIELKIEIDESQYEFGEGDIYLFGCVLNQFLSQYVTLNTFVILTFVESLSKKEWSWIPQQGKIMNI